MPQAMGDDQYRRWLRLLEYRTGIDMHAVRKSYLETVLSIRMQEIDCPDFDSYYHQVAGEYTPEWPILIDRLTIHETRFYRHRPSLELLREVVLHPLLETQDGALDLQLWSVGCASGEEAYSLAMLFDEQLAQGRRNYYLGVTATDISGAVLSTARRGVYHQRRLSELPARLVEQYFNAVDDEHYEVIDALRKRVCFTQLNVRDLAQAPFKAMDVIFCQNMLIYFDQERRRDIVAQLCTFLNPNGVLVLGVGEVSGWIPPGMERIDYQDTLAFRRLPS